MCLSFRFDWMFPAHIYHIYILRSIYYINNTILFICRYIYKMFMRVLQKRMMSLRHRPNMFTWFLVVGFLISAAAFSTTTHQHYHHHHHRRYPRRHHHHPGGALLLVTTATPQPVRMMMMMMMMSPQIDDLPLLLLLSSSVGSNPMTTMLNDWYGTYPYGSAFVTCAIKGGLADYLVQQQQQQQDQLNTDRNLGFILYGGFYQGLFQQYMYGTVFPQYFHDAAVATTSNNNNNDIVATATTILLPQLLMDMLILGPLLCLPISYIVQSLCASSSSPSSFCVETTTGTKIPASKSSTKTVPWWILSSITSSNRHPIMVTSPAMREDRHHDSHFFRDSFQHDFSRRTTTVQNDEHSAVFLQKIRDGIEQYRVDIADQNILLKYWSLWIPIKCITFTMIPQHLRIAFIAIISFFWMMILSSSSSSGTPELDHHQGKTS